VNQFSLLNTEDNKTMVKFDDSQQQFINSDAYPMFCLAGAGSGKTSALLGKAQRLAMDPNREGTILILCFNKSIQDELNTRLTESRLNLLGVEAKTLHGLGKSFIEKAINVNKKPLNIIANYKNKHLYFGWIRKDDRKKYGSYPGLLSKFLDIAKIKGPSELEDANINTKINLLAMQMLSQEAVHNAPLDYNVKTSIFFPKIMDEVKELLLSSVPKASISHASTVFSCIAYATEITEAYLYKVEAKRKPTDFWKFFVRTFYHNGFVEFVHNSITDFIFKKDLYGKFAKDDLDYAPTYTPMFIKLSVEHDLDCEMSYDKYSEILKQEFGAIAITDIITQIQVWGELDFDSMLSIGCYAMLKMKHNYHAVMVDEAQDLSLLYWYMTYEAFPKYLIKDKSKRLVYVGDIEQAINRWNCACPERFVALANEHNKTQLIYSYRCPEAIVAKANELKSQALVKVHLEEDQFISAAPKENQPGIYSKIETMDASSIEDFLVKEDYKVEDVAILGRTNHDLMPWQLWAILKQIPCQELLINKLELKTENVKVLLCLVALSADDALNDEIATGVLDILKGKGTAEKFEHHLSSVAEEPDELILKYFTSLNLRDEEDLSPDEIREIAMGKGASKIIRDWYAKDKFKLKSEFKSYISRKFLELEFAPKGVTISTIHRFKGRERPVIFIQSNSWSNINAGAIKKGSIPRMEEERCLAYVAITRAKKATYVINGNMHPSL